MSSIDLDDQSRTDGNPARNLGIKCTTKGAAEVVPCPGCGADMTHHGDRLVLIDCRPFRFIPGNSS